MSAVKVNVTKFSKSKQNAAAAEQVVESTVVEPIEQKEETIIKNDTEDNNEDMPDFLDALTNDKYVNKKQQQEESKQKELEAKEKDKQRKESLKQMKEFEKARIAEEKAASKRKPTVHQQDDNMSVCSNDIFSSSNHSVIIGKEKRVLLNKVQSYKELFKEELKGFKIKKNCNTEELKDYIAEMDCIIETGTVETFMSDSIYSCIKIIEGVSANTKKYDVSGLSVLLQNNKQFNSLLKQLFLKYQVFSNVPPEYQIVLIVATSAFICRNKNLNKDNLNAYFNEPIVVPV